MTTHDITALISQRITDYAEEGARAQRAQAACHERAMQETPGTPERNTSNGLVAASNNRKQKARAAYMALIDVAHHTHLMNGYETAAAVKLGKHNAGASQWEVTIR